MKVVTNKLGTLFYPFVEPDGSISGSSSFVFACNDGTIKLVWKDEPMMSAENARLLAKALEYAAQVAEKEVCWSEERD